MLAYGCNTLDWLRADALYGPDLRCSAAADVQLLVEGELSLEEIVRYGQHGYVA